MTTKIWEFRALDTLFFRDGTPHNTGEGGGVGIKSLFPPYIFTLQGAVRTALALGQNWRPGGDIPFPAKLGDGDDLGEVSFEGPYLKNEEDYLYPVPLNLLHKDLEQFSYVLPSEKLYETDMGQVRIPEFIKSLPGAKTMTDFYITKPGLENILNDNMLALNKGYFENRSNLWREEERAGIAIDKRTGTSKDEMLYFTSHIRPRQKLGIVVKVKGLKEIWHTEISKAIPLGGEGRMATIKIENEHSIVPAIPKIESRDGKIKFTVTLITPGCIWPLETGGNAKGKMENLIEKGFPFIPGKCVSACIGKLEQVGGFDLEKRSRDH